jgi:phosphatidylserine/phosphatidylglycerophosphate/cardiolipin synthase-like enzyme
MRNLHVGQPFSIKDGVILALLLLLSASLFALALAISQNAPPCAGCNARVSLVMSPGAKEDVITFIRSAKESIDVEMYVFTSEDMVRELSDAVKRGVRVRVIMEPRVEDSRKQKIFDELSALGIEARWASFAYKLTHAKYIIVDGKKAIVGSINWSESALNLNREAAVEVDGEKVQELATAFEEDWQKSGFGEAN